MTIKLPKLIATSVVRGSQQGESHGGVFTVDFDKQEGEQRVDWNTTEIDFDGRGADRGLRGITFSGDDIYIAASDELFCYDQTFKIQDSFKNRHLKHCHEICRMENTIFLSPYREGLLFNDTQSDCVRYSGRDGSNQAFKIVTYDDADIEFAGIDDSKIARQAFGRGLCPVGERFIAGGSSPSTISLYDLETKQKVGSVNLTMDIRNAIHGLEPWPYDD